jgi:hypothetical protein
MKLSKSIVANGDLYQNHKGFSLSMVEMTGIEPVTCGLQSHRSPN